MSWSGERRAAPTDAFIESYVCWHEACDDVRTAYRRWTTGNAGERGLWFAAYRAALEREQHASDIYSHCAALVSSSPLPHLA